MIKSLQAIASKSVNAKSAQSLIVWGLPALSIPVLRSFSEKPERRTELFARDLLTYTVGATCYFVGHALSHKALNPAKLSESTKEVVSTALGTAVSSLFAGVGATRLAEKIAPQPHSNVMVPNKALGSRLNVMSPVSDMKGLGTSPSPFQTTRLSLNSRPSVTPRPAMAPRPYMPVAAPRLYMGFS